MYIYQGNSNNMFKFIGDSIDDQMQSVNLLAATMSEGQNDVLFTIMDAVEIPTGYTTDDVCTQLFQTTTVLEYADEEIFTTEASDLWADIEAAGEALLAAI